MLSSVRGEKCVLSMLDRDEGGYKCDVCCHCEQEGLSTSPFHANALCYITDKLALLYILSCVVHS